MKAKASRRYSRRNSRLATSGRGRNLVLTEVLSDFLKRVEKRPVEGIVRLYPFITKDRHPDAPRTVAVDPTVAFGKPVIAGTGIPTAAVFQLFNAGDDIRETAEEYDRDPSEIEAAIRYESVRASEPPEADPYTYTYFFVRQPSVKRSPTHSWERCRRWPRSWRRSRAFIARIHLVMGG